MLTPHIGSEATCCFDGVLQLEDDFGMMADLLKREGTCREVISGH